MIWTPKKIRSPKAAYEAIETVLEISGEAVEKFGIITLNSKNEIAGLHILSIGSLNATVMCPRVIFQAALLNNAAAIICFHNHPSGDPTPSNEDVEVTKKTMEAGELIGIEVIDHLIIGAGKFVSLKEQGLIGR
ncbi:JAB domain-containing protein [Paenibacillus naphthalenovorans]|uniref:JAB domain-containing protein n=1 Tax=Paenibacillus naphthalenovorans TaxID=162209 RepID=UPI003D2C72F4